MQKTVTSRKHGLVLSGTTTPGQSGPGSDGNEEIIRIPHKSSITGTSPLDCLVSYPGHSLGESYSSAEMQSVYSTAPADWVICIWYLKPYKMLAKKKKNDFYIT